MPASLSAKEEKPPPLNSHGVSRLLKILPWELGGGRVYGTRKSVVYAFFSWAFFFSVAVLGLCSWAGFSLVAVSRGYTPVAVHGHLMAVASLHEEHGL